MGTPMSKLVLNCDWCEHYYYCLPFLFPFFLQVTDCVVIEVQASVKQSDIVAATNTIREIFLSLSSSRLLEFGYIAGLLFLTQDTDDQDDKDNSAPAGIYRKVCNDPSSASQKYWTLIKGGPGVFNRMWLAQNESRKRMGPPQTRSIRYYTLGQTRELKGGGRMDTAHHHTSFSVGPFLIFFALSAKRKGMDEWSSRLSISNTTILTTLVIFYFLLKYARLTAAIPLLSASLFPFLPHRVPPSNCAPQTLPKSQSPQKSSWEGGRGQESESGSPARTY